MRTWFIFIGCGVGALVAVWGLAHVLPPELTIVPTILYSLIIIGGSIGSMLVRTHLEKKNLTAEPDSIEHDLALRAGSDAFVYSLVIAAAFGLYLMFVEQFESGLIAYGLIALSICLYWCRYALLRRRVTADS